MSILKNHSRNAFFPKSIPLLVMLQLAIFSEVKLNLALNDKNYKQLPQSPLYAFYHVAILFQKCIKLSRSQFQGSMSLAGS